VAVPLTPVKVLSQWLVPRVSHQSRLSPNDKVDNEVKLGAVHRSPGICPTAEENARKTQIGDHLMKIVRPVVASNVVS
jgi:hypothetical protein